MLNKPNACSTPFNLRTVSALVCNSLVYRTAKHMIQLIKTTENATERNSFLGFILYHCSLQSTAAFFTVWQFKE
jgi:hypothetical protein